MPNGLVRSGDFRNGTPILLPHNFGNSVSNPEPFGNVNPQSNTAMDSNPVTWLPSPAHFGNQVEFSLQSVPSIVVIAPGGTGSVDINLTQLLDAPTATLSYTGAPTGVTVAFAPNPDTGMSVATVTVAATVPVGKYTITVIGNGVSEKDTTNIQLVVAGAVIIPPTPTQPTPTFSPAAGTYVGTTMVTITSTGADNIYYTTDGSTPTTGSTLYSGPISVAASETLKALAVKSGYVNSAIGSASYTITPAGIAFVVGVEAFANTPAVSVTTGAINTTGATLLVALCSRAGATITDSKSNSWQGLTTYANGQTAQSQILYAYAPTVGAGHTFTVSTVDGSSMDIIVYAFSGTRVTSSVFEAGSDLGAIGTPPTQPGSVTPAAIGDLVISGFCDRDDNAGGTAPASVNSSMTIAEQTVDAHGISALAYLITAASGAVNPTWNTASNPDVLNGTTNIAVFAKA